MASWKDLDPLLRAMRAVAILSFIGVMLYILITREPDASVVAILAGSILIALGYNAADRLPGLTDMVQAFRGPPKAAEPAEDEVVIDDEEAG